MSRDEIKNLASRTELHDEHWTAAVHEALSLEAWEPSSLRLTPHRGNKELFSPDTLVMTDLAHVSLQKPADGYSGKSAKDRPSGLEKSTQTKLDQTRTELLNAAEDVIQSVGAKPDSEVMLFQKNLREMESGMKERHLSTKEITDCMQTIKRLVTESGTTDLPTSARFGLARDLVKLFRDPTDTTQLGNTCAANAFLVNALWRQPSMIGKLVADSGLTGKFTTKDGTVIKTPDSAIHRPSGRPWAEHLAATMIVNVVWQRSTGLDPRAKKGDIVYDPFFTEDGKTGERLVIAGKPFKGYWNPKSKSYEGADSPHISTSSFPGVFEQISGRRPDNLLIGWGMPKSGDAHLYYSSPKDLENKLGELKKKGNGFPLIATVDVRNPPFSMKPSSPTSSHAVNVIDFNYDPKTKQGYVWVDNTWDKSQDHSGKKGELARLTVQEFYDASREYREKK